MASKKITRQLSIYINGSEVKNSLGAIGREIGKVKGQLREANDPEKIKKYKAELIKLQGAYGDVKEEIKGTNDVLEDARGHFSSIFSGLKTGDFNQVNSGFKGVLGNLKNIIKASLSFIATPFGAVITVLTAIGFGVKKWVDYNLEIEKTNQLVRDLTQESGIAVDAIRIRAEILNKTFKVDIKESIETAKSMAKSFGVSYDEAFDVIEQGALRGKLSNAEYLDSLKEYPVQFKNAGFSVQEFAKIVETGIDLSIYQDKLPDAIKEFSLSVTEETKVARESLVNAFGSSFTDDLFKNLKSGAITAKGALKLISKQAKEVGLNAQQAQQLTADLFKGAGEDAGGALKIFEAINLALNEQQKPLTELQKIKQEQLDTEKKINSISTQVFANSSKGIGLMIEKGKLFANKVLLKILKGGVDVYNWFIELNNESGVFSAVLSSLGKVAVTPFKIIAELVTATGKVFGGLSEIIQGVFTFDTDKIKSGLSKGLSALPDVLKKVKKEVVNDVKDIYSAFQGGNKVKKFSLKDFVADESQGGSSSSNAIGSAKGGEGNKRTKEALQKKKDLYEKSEQELNALLNKKQKERELQQKTGIDRELAQIDDKYAKEILKYTLSEEEKKNLTLEQVAQRENAIQQLEAEKSQEKHELKKQRDLAFREELKSIEEENRIAEEEETYEREAEAAGSEEERQLILLEKAKSIALLELEIEKNKELEKVKNIEGAEKMKEAIRKKYTIKTDKINREHTTAEKELKSDTVQWTKLTEEQKLGIIKSALNSASTVFNEGSDAWKATKIAETTIATYQSATNAYSSLAGIPVVGPAMGVVASGLAIASGIRNVQKIASTPLKKMPKHYYGGHTGEKAVYSDEYGSVTGVVHDNEWVAPKFMTQSPKYAPTIQWLEGERQANLKGYYDGGHTSTVGVSSDPESTLKEGVVDVMLYEEIKRLNNLLDQGIVATTLIGDDNIATLNIREQKLINARERAKIR